MLISSKLIKKVSLVGLAFFLFFSQLYAQNEETGQGSQFQLFTASQQKLRIKADQVRLIADKENGGYHLYVKKSENVKNQSNSFMTKKG